MSSRRKTPVAANPPATISTISSATSSREPARPRHRQISAYLVVWGTRCDPDEITRRTGIIPDAAWQVGDVLNERTGTKRRDAGWQIEAPADLGIDVGEYVQHVLRRVAPERDYFRSLDESCQVQISVVVRGREQAPVFNLPSDVVTQIGALGAALDVDIYC
jgi:hypothetical protein